MCVLGYQRFLTLMHFQYNSSQTVTGDLQYDDIIKRNSKSEGSIKCFMYDLQEKALAFGWNANGVAGRVNPADFETVMPSFMDSANADYMRMSSLYSNHIGWNGQTLKFVAVSVESKSINTYSQRTEEVTRRLYDAHEALRNNINDIAKEACGSEVMMTDHPDAKRFITMNNQRIYRESAMTGAFLGVAVAFVVLLLCTRSPILSFLSAISITCTLISVIGFTTMLGWDLGIFEAILISILAGFSVDYVVHLAHAYSHAAGTRDERVIHALSEMGSPVLSGMMTSVLASLPLFMCTMVFFIRFAMFLCFTIAFSWLFANFFFMSLLATVGPQDTSSSNKGMHALLGALNVLPGLIWFCHCLHTVHAADEASNISSMPPCGPSKEESVEDGSDAGQAHNACNMSIAPLEGTAPDSPLPNAASTAVGDVIVPAA